MSAEIMTPSAADHTMFVGHAAAAGRLSGQRSARSTIRASGSRGCSSGREGDRSFGAVSMAGKVQVCAKLAKLGAACLWRKRENRAPPPESPSICLSVCLPSILPARRRQPVAGDASSDSSWLLEITLLARPPLLCTRTPRAGRRLFRRSHATPTRRVCARTAQTAGRHASWLTSWARVTGCCRRLLQCCRHSLPLLAVSTTRRAGSAHMGSRPSWFPTLPGGAP